MTTHNLPGSDAVRHVTGDAGLTVMIAAHQAFRRDLVSLARATGSAGLSNPARRQSVSDGWEVFKRQLHLHRRGADTFTWPAPRQRLSQRQRPVRPGCNGRRARPHPPPRAAFTVIDPYGKAVLNLAVLAGLAFMYRRLPRRGHDRSLVVDLRGLERAGRLILPGASPRAPSRSPRAAGDPADAPANRSPARSGGGVQK